MKYYFLIILGTLIASNLHAQTNIITDSTEYFSLYDSTLFAKRLLFQNEQEVDLNSAVQRLNQFVAYNVDIRLLRASSYPEKIRYEWILLIFRSTIATSTELYAGLNGQAGHTEAWQSNDKIKWRRLNLNNDSLPFYKRHIEKDDFFVNIAGNDSTFILIKRPSYPGVGDLLFGKNNKHSFEEDNLNYNRDTYFRIILGWMFIGMTIFFVIISILYPDSILLSYSVYLIISCLFFIFDQSLIDAYILKSFALPARSTPALLIYGRNLSFAFFLYIYSSVNNLTLLKKIALFFVGFCSLIVSTIFLLALFNIDRGGLLRQIWLYGCIVHLLILLFIFLIMKKRRISSAEYLYITLSSLSIIVYDFAWAYGGDYFFLVTLLGTLLLTTSTILIAFTIANKLLASKRDTIEAQQETLRVVEEQKDVLERTVDERTADLRLANARITDSIQYASRIQGALLPDLAALQSADVAAALHYQPRDVVGGDFYWFARQGYQVVIAVADCTGHGVPGAFMSVLGTSLLKQLVVDRGMTQPAEILTRLDAEMRQALKQDGLDLTALDGMDIGILTLVPDLGQGLYAGANRPLLLQRGSAWVEYKGTRRHVGGRQVSEIPYGTEALQLLPDDRLYLLTDGITDQLGGPESAGPGRKWGWARLKEQLTQHPLPSDDPTQTAANLAALQEALRSWQGSRPQLDDQLLLGLRL